MQILVINSGSSSIKFSIFAITADPDPRSIMEGELSNIGADQATLELRTTSHPTKSEVDAPDFDHAITLVHDTLSASNIPAFDAIGYRVVHPGPKLRSHQRITLEVLADLDQAADFAPLHDPSAVKMIRAFMEKFPNLPHYACFDTIFHQTMPEEATLYPLPPEYAAQGVHRYGFHGLSCESIVRQLHDIPHRMVIAHLGSGCSLTALLDGRSIDNTMGLTPTGGVIMGTRSGDLDPGLVLYLLRIKKQTIDSIESLLNHNSGLVALSGLPNNVKALREAANDNNTRAALALKIFTRSITKAIGSFAWLLGGLDAIIFAGGIGEHDPQTRHEILANLQRLNVEIDATRNQAASNGIQHISTDSSRTAVLIVPAQEDLMIAVHVNQMSQQDRGAS